MILTVDLASKFSAACIMDVDGTVVDQCDTWALGQDKFLEWIVRPWRMGSGLSRTFEQTEWVDGPPDVLIIEDLPHRVPFMTITKKVCRLQGRIEEKMRSMDQVGAVMWLPPDVWQKSYGITTAKGAAELVQPKAEELGYHPPYDYTLFKGKDRQTARKANTDYCSAYLIARWANKYFAENNTYDAPRTSRFPQNAS